MFQIVPRSTVLAVIALLAPTVAVAESSPPPAFGPSETGCPSYFGGQADGPAVDPGQVGPFGTSQQQLTGFGVTVDADELTVSLPVRDMRRQSAPGYRWTYWEVFFGVNTQNRGKQLEIYYDAVHDAFSFWAGQYNGSFQTKRKVDGVVVPGTAGGVAITVPLETLNLDTGEVLTNLAAESGNFISYIYMNPPDYLTGTYPSGIYAPQWDLTGPEVFPILSCPGLSVTASDLGKGRGVRIEGLSLPAEPGQEILIERATADGWTEVGAGETQDLGGIFFTVPLSPGPVTLRATLTTRLLGDVTSDPISVTVTP